MFFRDLDGVQGEVLVTKPATKRTRQGCRAPRVTQDGEATLVESEGAVDVADDRLHQGISVGELSHQGGRIAGSAGKIVPPARAVTVARPAR